MNIDKDVIEKIKAKAAEFLPMQIELLEEYAKFDSETHYIEGNKRAVELTKKHLQSLMPEFQEFEYPDVGTHLLAKVRPENSKGRIILNAHLDTVFPVGYAKKYPPHTDKDWLSGLGMIDCKGGVVVSIYAVRILNELGILPEKEIDFLFTCDEEQGSMTGRDVYSKIAPGAEAAFIFEPGYKIDGRIPILTSRQGVIIGNLDIKGIEAHAGCDYSKGRSANKELAHKILELYSFNDENKGIYYNAAPVSGGRPNGVVSGDANMQFCVAGIPDWEAYHECESKLDKFAQNTYDPYCQLELSYRMLFPPQIRHKKTASIISSLGKAADMLGVKIMEDGANSCGEDRYAATDANYLAEYDIPALDGFGPEGFGMHRTDEKVFIPSILEKTVFFAAYLYLLSNFENID